ncbi:hypothetical protein QYM36_007798, partial [Artemia franciscana]
FLPFFLPSWQELCNETQVNLRSSMFSPYTTLGNFFFSSKFKEEICLDLSKSTKTRSMTPDDTLVERNLEIERNKLRFASTGKICRRKRRGLSDPVRTPKSLKKLMFDDDTAPPVSGTIIVGPEGNTNQKGPSVDIDPTLNFVEVTEEAREELARIENKIGDYICRLCKIQYNDAFALAQHRCSRIVHLSYVCSECDKVFNCPANLASHRRWHQPRAQHKSQNAEDKRKPTQKHDSTSDCQNNNSPMRSSNGILSDYPTYACWKCFKTFSLLIDMHRHNCSFGNISPSPRNLSPIRRTGT